MKDRTPEDFIPQTYVNPLFVVNRNALEVVRKEIVYAMKQDAPVWHFAKGVVDANPSYREAIYSFFTGLTYLPKDTSSATFGALVGHRFLEATYDSNIAQAQRPDMSLQPLCRLGLGILELRDGGSCRDIDSRFVAASALVKTMTAYIVALEKRVKEAEEIGRVNKGLQTQLDVMRAEVARHALIRSCEPQKREPLHWTPDHDDPSYTSEPRSDESGSFEHLFE